MGDLFRRLEENAGPGGLGLPLGTSRPACPRGPAQEGAGAPAPPCPGKFFSALEGQAVRLQALQVGRARAGVSQEGAAPGLRLGVGGRCDLGAGSRWTAPLPLSPHPAQKQPPRRGAPPTATCRDAPSLPASSHGLTLAARKVMPQLDSTFRTPRFCSFSDGGVGSPLPRRHQGPPGPGPRPGPPEGGRPGCGQLA